jgi:hypothetical protein
MITSESPSRTTSESPSRTTSESTSGSTSGNTNETTSGGTTGKINICREVAKVHSKPSLVDPLLGRKGYKHNPRIIVAKLKPEDALTIVQEFWKSEEPYKVLETHKFVGSSVPGDLYELSWAYMSLIPVGPSMRTFSGPYWREAEEDEITQAENTTSKEHVFSAMFDTQCRGGPHFKAQYMLGVHQIPSSLRNVLHGVICRPAVARLSKQQQVTVYDAHDISQDHFIEGFTGSSFDPSPQIVRPQLIARDYQKNKYVVFSPILYVIPEWQGPDIAFGTSEANNYGLRFTSPYTMRFERVGIEVSTAVFKGVQ